MLKLKKKSKARCRGRSWPQSKTISLAGQLALLWGSNVRLPKSFVPTLKTMPISAKQTIVCVPTLCVFLQAHMTF